MLKAFSQICANRHQGIIQNGITANRNKLKKHLRISKILSTTQRVLLEQLHDLHDCSRCTDVQQMKNALWNLNNVMVMNDGWGHCCEEYGWTFKQVEILATIGGKQKNAWEVREIALLFLEDSQRYGCQRAEQYLDRLTQKAQVAAANFFTTGHEQSDAFRDYQNCCSRHVRLQCEAAILAGDHRWLMHSPPASRHTPRFFDLKSAPETPYAPTDSDSAGDSQCGGVNAR